MQSKVLRVESREVYRELASIALMTPVLAPASEVAQVKSLDAFSFKVMATGERPLTRQLREAQKIANDVSSGQLINGRNEHIAPAFQQLAPRDIL